MFQNSFNLCHFITLEEQEVAIPAASTMWDNFGTEDHTNHSHPVLAPICSEWIGNVMNCKSVQWELRDQIRTSSHAICTQHPLEMDLQTPNKVEVQSLRDEAIKPVSWHLSEGSSKEEHVKNRG